MIGVRFATVAAALTVALMLGPTPANAVFPGDNGLIAFQSTFTGGFCDFDAGNDTLRTVRPDGSDLRTVTHGCHPSWSPEGGRIAFDYADLDGLGTETVWLWTVQPDGSQLEQRRDGADPSWSPEADRFVFEDGGITVGPIEQFSAPTPLTRNRCDTGPAWSPLGGLIAFARVCGTDAGLYTIRPDGTGLTRITSGHSPNWSPDGRRLAFVDNRDGNPEIYALTVTQQATPERLTNDPAADNGPAWSPDGRLIVFSSNRDGSDDLYVLEGDITTRLTTGEDALAPDWQPVPRDPYARPRSASPLRVPLVPAFKPCSAPNSAHGAPLAYPSCAPPVKSSQHLTVGTPDANGRPAQSIGFLRLAVRLGDPGTPANEADVVAHLSIRDVRRHVDLTDYTGELEATVLVRVTDRNNGVGGPSTQAATVVDIPFPVRTSCAGTPDPSIGATCAVDTTFNAIVPGAIVEGKRAIWALGQAQVFDGGPDGQVATADNTRLAVQGLFVP